MKASWAWVILLAGTACEVRSFPILGIQPDGGPGVAQPRPDAGQLDVPRLPQPSDGGPGLEAGTNDVLPGTCTASQETCNGRDDDCDGQVDEDFDFNTSSEHCGRCDNRCSLANAAVACSAARCVLRACATGFIDLDRVSVNGCECAVSNGGVESCDGEDNDCNGSVDEGFDLAVDPDNCGACGQRCAYAGASPLCDEGRCALGACQPGFVNLDRAAQNGCEYACTPAPDGQELCDGLDNDCDGEIDEADPRAGKPCFPPSLQGCDPETGGCQGTCALGTWSCLPGGLVCQNATPPAADVCDRLDNDCDGRTDEDFDLANDPRFCGGCGNVCDLANAINGCAQGTCTVAFCRTGYVDLDLAAANGCEYVCTRDGPEVCDARDNDCDGLTDEADPDLRFPAINFCNRTGECGRGGGTSSRYPGDGTFPTCSVAPGGNAPDWFCNYPATVQLFAPNQVLGQETWCDGLDNDCDGATDEHTDPRVGSSCTDDGLGICRKTGVLRCQADRDLAPACDVSAAATVAPAHEICDAKDNDCDGLVDESWDNPGGGVPCGGSDCRGVRDDIIHVTAGGNDFYIYRHEAVRADAGPLAEGIEDARACSTGGGHIPWTGVTYDKAQAACAAAGMRLCKTSRPTACTSEVPLFDEWGAACAAGLICPADPGAYPYGCGFSPFTCNGLDAAQGAAVAGGGFSACATPDLDPGTPSVESAFDMSGNVAEWTDDCRGTLGDGSGRRIYTLRGGSYLNIARALRCDFTSLVVAQDFAFPDTGFRCCSSCAVGRADCGSSGCVDQATDTRHCGRCDRQCAPAERCDNGVCR
jgi:hypothetical protein